MGLLAPLYALAALAIAGPIIFHLIKRQPQGQQRFSSLMFLSPSPPRLTRRSRLDNILLLILRALAIGLVAIAFTRPFFRQESFLSRSLEGRNIALLIDTSASMQRSDVWDKAKEQATTFLATLSPTDRVSLYTISDSLGAVLPLDTENAADTTSQMEAVRAAIAELKPTWRGSQLADGLKSLADFIQGAALTGKIDSNVQSEIVLVSDLHANSGIESLQGYPWPESIRLDVRQIRPTVPGNARASVLAADDSSTTHNDVAMKVRVENNSDSKGQAFELVWIVDGKPSTSKTAIQVPAGQVRVIPVPTRPPNAKRLELIGDGWEGDNALFLADNAPSRERILFCGAKSGKTEDDPGYFIAKAPLSTPMIQRIVEQVLLADLAKHIQTEVNRSNAAEPVRSIILEPPLEDALIPTLRAYVEQGGCVIVSLPRPLMVTRSVSEDSSVTRSVSEDSIIASLRQLFSEPTLTVTEARTKDYALLGKIDYQSPVFRPFADPRFNDFSKIRFWNHRIVRFAADHDAGKPGSLRAIASLDDGSPWLMQSRVGKGNLWLVTSGWQPTSSQMGLSSKFVPILMGVLDPTGKTLTAQLTYDVGQAIPVEDLPNIKVKDADGKPIEVAVTSNAIQLDKPGLYYLESDDSRRQVVVQIPANESRLTPLDSDIFEQYGIDLGTVQTDAQRKQTARQLQAAELERKQRVWQWLLLAGLIVLALESALAGWFSRRNFAKPSVNVSPQAG
jgi:von Willebrand factor type A domain/Aerotolerance regulator N-terminal